MRKAPEQAPLSPNFHTTTTPPRPSLWTLYPMGESVDVGCEHQTSERTFDPIHMIQLATDTLHVGSSMESGFESGNPPASRPAPYHSVTAALVVRKILLRKHSPSKEG
ncbi:hypothetical protein AVEN_260559-1 [Araneus ventricosus]|uniref:Uncharacterized protein n=1 Tax=Araneus ventricosus TaxID=182803 RepID=A0A4Y2TZW5_ARAVE|nr:hypothetical protein AVEN_260559-1 [Araneus ventricosus]